MIILINKMDDPTVEWSETRYNECCEKLLPYLKKCGFNPKTELYFMPCSGLTGAYLKEPVSESLCPWFRLVIALNDSIFPLTIRFKFAEANHSWTILIICQP